MFFGKTFIRGLTHPGYTTMSLRDGKSKKPPGAKARLGEKLPTALPNDQCHELSQKPYEGGKPLSRELRLFRLFRIVQDYTPTRSAQATYLAFNSLTKSGFSSLKS